jgi:hypothetical protein
MELQEIKLLYPIKGAPHCPMKVLLLKYQQTKTRNLYQKDPKKSHHLDQCKLEDYFYNKHMD